MTLTGVFERHDVRAEYIDQTLVRSGAVVVVSVGYERLTVLSAPLSEVPLLSFTLIAYLETLSVAAIE